MKRIIVDSQAEKDALIAVLLAEKSERSLMWAVWRFVRRCVLWCGELVVAGLMIATILFLALVACDLIIGTFGVLGLPHG